MKEKLSQEQIQAEREKLNAYTNRVTQECEKLGLTVVIGVFNNENGVFTTEAMGNMLVMLGLCDTLTTQIREEINGGPRMMMLKGSDMAQILGGLGKPEGGFEV